MKDGFGADAGTITMYGWMGYTRTGSLSTDWTEGEKKENCSRVRCQFVKSHLIGERLSRKESEYVVHVVVNDSGDGVQPKW